MVKKQDKDNSKSRENQGKSLLEVMSALRERVWHVCEIEYRRIHIDIDTTVETIYGKQQSRS